jgi:hypothetical protein
VTAAATGDACDWPDTFGALKCIMGYVNVNVAIWFPCVGCVAAHKGNVNAVSITSDGLIAVSGGEDCTVQVHRLDRDGNIVSSKLLSVRNRSVQLIGTPA